MFTKVLVANRGAIARRVIRTLRRMGVSSVAAYSDADKYSAHVSDADEAVHIGPGPAAQSYLNAARIIEAAQETGAQAIHPGYGFLSENAAFADACEAARIRFIGPRPEHIRAFGLKHTAREIARANAVPLLPGTGVLPDVDAALAAAERIGYPVMLKSSAGGGGIGMRLCRSEDELSEAFEATARLSRANFGDAALFVEKFVEQARHIEVQVFGDGAGRVLALGERDCSVQRRNQKIIEETPAPGLPGEVRARLFDAAVRVCRSVNYESAGTVEFIYDNDTQQFYFLEVNTRLQVEHGVTEEVTGIDLVEWMIRQAAGQRNVLPDAAPVPHGHSVQVRVYAEDPGRDFQPCAGLLTHAAFPEGVRVESWVASGSEVSPFYDSMLAKIIVRAENRHVALRHMSKALRQTVLGGIETNIAYLRQIVADPRFVKGEVTTGLLKTLPYRRAAVEVMEGGTQTTVQDTPGRLGYWHVGVPPSGPMDTLAFRIGNRLVGNDQHAAGLEMAVSGPVLKFHSDAVIAVCGADMAPKLNGESIPLWQAIRVSAGSVLSLSAIHGAGARCYLAVRGGFDVPPYLGSRSTFILGRFGGHAGRTLRTGDVLHIGKDAITDVVEREPSAIVPHYSSAWRIAVLYGPHGAPEFFTPSDIDAFFAADWQVHYNSDRTGVRLIGPKPKWARKDGGEAGLHPSNIHDNAYAVGTVDFTGDMPVILGPDGPSLGGFVCPASIAQADLWKIGQLKPGDTVRFHPVSHEAALAMERRVEESLADLRTPLPAHPRAVREEPVLVLRPPVADARCSQQLATPDAASLLPATGRPGMVCRADGDKYLLIEYGENVLDLHLRFRVHALEQRLRAMAPAGVIDITPGIRSLQIHYDSLVLDRRDLLAAIDAAEAGIERSSETRIPSRIVHLPLSWDDPQTQLAIRKYMQSVRPDAPWCPDNIEFIRRINGLDSLEDVHRIVFDASYLVMGLGDVYLGAPVATPVDPRHRLVTTKYNPARTWTPENAVGIGGAYLCVYGMEGPGGYQFVGRTVQMWSTYRNLTEDTPWLLRFFDQIRFYPVSAKELLDFREAFPHGRFDVRTEATDFSLPEYDAFLGGIADEASAFKARQQAAFDAERERWVASGLHTFDSAPPSAGPAALSESVLPEGCDPVRSPVTACVWNVAVQPGQRVEAGDRLVILEAMKMEVAVSAPRSGVVEEVRCMPGALVNAGQNLVVLRAESAR